METHYAFAMETVALPLETEMETKGQNWKRTGNEGRFLETNWKGR
ncbi:MAG: hypothetical protein V4675_06950 [Verrucomicrobiota bacterium]